MMETGAYRPHACACVGPRPGETLCPCRLEAQRAKIKPYTPSFPDLLPPPITRGGETQMDRIEKLLTKILDQLDPK